MAHPEVSELMGSDWQVVATTVALQAFASWVSLLQRWIRSAAPTSISSVSCNLPTNARREKPLTETGRALLAHPDISELMCSDWQVVATTVALQAFRSWFVLVLQCLAHAAHHVTQALPSSGGHYDFDDFSDGMPSAEVRRDVALKVATGAAGEEEMKMAAHCLLSSEPAHQSSNAFHVPDTTGKERRRGVPLSLCAQHSAVAWEIDGKSKLAPKSSQDPSDAW
jgi:hypothetical protein